MLFTKPAGCREEAELDRWVEGLAPVRVRVRFAKDLLWEAAVEWDPPTSGHSDCHGFPRFRDVNAWQPPRGEFRDGLNSCGIIGISPAQSIRNHALRVIFSTGREIKTTIATLGVILSRNLIGPHSKLRCKFACGPNSEEEQQKCVRRRHAVARLIGFDATNTIAGESRVQTDSEMAISFCP